MLQIRELCYALMFTIYANYAPQISHYAPEIYHYASKQDNFFRSQKHIFTSKQLQNTYKTGPARTLGGIFPQVFNVFSIAQDCDESCARSCAIRQATGTTTGLVAFGHFFLSSHMEIAHAQYTRG